MDQFKQPGVGAGLAYLFDHAKTHATAPVHRHTGGLVDGQECLVLENHRKLPGGCRIELLFFRPLGQAYRRNAQHVTGLHPIVRPDPALVPAHFTRADDAVDVGLGHPLELAEQEVVEALPGRLFVHREVPHGGGCGVRGLKQGIRRGNRTPR
ncbi:hypothetical protein D9M68_812670 [compost metagenome]